MVEQAVATLSPSRAHPRIAGPSSSGEKRFDPLYFREQTGDVGKQGTRRTALEANSASSKDYLSVHAHQFAAEKSNERSASKKQRRKGGRSKSRET